MCILPHFSIFELKILFLSHLQLWSCPRPAFPFSCDCKSSILSSIPSPCHRLGGTLLSIYIHVFISSCFDWSSFQPCISVADWALAEGDTVKACTPNLQALTGWKKPCVIGVLLINTVGSLQRWSSHAFFCKGWKAGSRASSIPSLRRISCA